MSVVDLGKEREDRNLKKFHKKFMGNVRDRVASRQALISAAKEQGVFDGFDIGDRIRTNKGNVFKVVGYDLQEVKNDSQKEMATRMYTSLGIGDVELIEIEGNYYRSMIIAESVSSDEYNSGTNMLFADMLRKLGFDKLTGPTGVTESFSEGALPENIERFIEELVPTDTGVSKLDDFIIAYEGFTDECNDDAYKRIETGQKNCIDDVYDEVQNEWNTRFIEHGEPIYQGHHYTEENPIMVSVYNHNSKKTIFDSLMDEDVIRDCKIQKAKDLIDRVPSLADILLDPQASLTDLILNKPEPRAEGDGDIFEESKPDWLMDKKYMMNQMIKKLQDSNMIHTAFILNYLRAEGIDWPELDIIEKSVKKLLSPSLWKMTLGNHHIIKDYNGELQAYSSMVPKSWSPDKINENFRPSTFEESKPDWMMDKKYVIGQMIKKIQNITELPNNIIYTAFILNTLRAEGIDWPELDIIEKSIKKEISPDYWKLTLGKHRIVKDNNGELVWAGRVMTLKEPDKINENFRPSKSDWMMDKKYVMGQMIKNLQDSNMLRTALILNTLRAKGIDWPELDIIEKSIKKELSPSLWKQTLGNHYIVKDNNGELVWVTKLVDVMTNMTEALKESDKINENFRPSTFEESKPDWLMDKKYVIGQMIKKIQNSNMLRTAFILNYLRAEGIDWPELDIIEKSIKKELSPGLWKLTLGNHHIVKDDNGELRAEGIDWPELVKLIRAPELRNLIEELENNPSALHNTKYKKEQRKKMLEGERWMMDKKYVIGQMIKKIQDSNMLDTAFILNYLRAKGIDWPELDIIEKSIKKELSPRLWNYVHSQNPIGKQNIEGYLDNYFKVRDKINENFRPSTFEESKPDWMMDKKYVIGQMIKKIQDSDMLQTAFILNTLRAEGIDWPELDIIEKSIKKEISPRLWKQTLGKHHVDKDNYGELVLVAYKINENFRPSTFLRVGRNLVELQLGWVDETKDRARSDVFVNGKSIGRYSFEGKSYRVDEDNLFETVEEAIAHLIKTNAPYALPQSNASDYLKTLVNYRL